MNAWAAVGFTFLVIVCLGSHKKIHKKKEVGAKGLKRGETGGGPPQQSRGWRTELV